MEWPKITLFGDSITRRSMDPDNGCWGSMIYYKVGSYFDVDMRGFEGYNSRYALKLMDQLFPKTYLEKVELFVLFFGHNDSWDTEPLHVPLDQYESNMRAIVKYLVDNGLEKRQLIMMTPTWYHHEAFVEYMRSLSMPEVGKTEESARQYRDVVYRIAQDNNIDCIDFFQTSLGYEPLAELFCDGVHFSRVGAKLLYDQLMPVIEKKLVAKYNKPLADIWHAVPFEQHPDVVAALEAYRRLQEGGSKN